MVRRPNAMAQILDLTRRLAEEYDAVPLPMVTRAVRSAVEAAQLFGDDATAALPTIERLAREDLDAVRTATETAATVTV